MPERQISAKFEESPRHAPAVRAGTAPAGVTHQISLISRNRCIKYSCELIEVS